MRIETIPERKIELYTFNELEDSVKEKVLDRLREWDVTDNFWSEAVIEDVTEIASIMGITIDNVYWSGFWSQGDGACFEGSFEYKKGSVEEIKSNYPTDKELISISKAYRTEQKKFFYKLYGTVKHRGHYYHEYCTVIDIQHEDYPPYADIDTDLDEVLRRFMQWIYSRLETEYDYLTSDEYLMERIPELDYEFTKDGETYE